jgi:hypothetical protein
MSYLPGKILIVLAVTKTILTSFVIFGYSDMLVFAAHF